jgi:voltage-gated potassium channel
MMPSITANHRLTQERWRQFTDIPLTVAAALFLVAYAWEVIADLRPPRDFTTETIMWIIWAIFVVDFVVNLILAPRRVRWFFTHFHEFLIVALPALRPLRLLRLVTLLSILQRGAGRALRGRVVIYAVGASIILVFVAALAELDVERGAPGSHIHNFGDALWWAVVTITSVGYGDIAPVTFVGRLIAIGVMIAGIALLGTVTATLASFFIDRVADTTKEESDETQAAIAVLTAEIAALRSDIAAARIGAPAVTVGAESRATRVDDHRRESTVETA